MSGPTFVNPAERGIMVVPYLDYLSHSDDRTQQKLRAMQTPGNIGLISIDLDDGAIKELSRLGEGAVSITPWQEPGSGHMVHLALATTRGSLEGPDSSGQFIVRVDGKRIWVPIGHDWGVDLAWAELTAEMSTVKFREQLSLVRPSRLPTPRGT